MKILVTGAAGFIGAHVSLKLIMRGDYVVGLDNLNEYYSAELKRDRLKFLVQPSSNFKFIQADLTDRSTIENLFKNHKFDTVIHLAAQAGVRYSLSHPHAYIDSNITGFLNVLEGCRTQKLHLVYASSSSVYGLCSQSPFSEEQNTDHPISLYAATKKSNELMAHSYSHLFRIPTTGLRFFTVYGPWGRPDMAVFLFTKSILENKPIKVFNHGKMIRDFTYIDDVVTGVIKISDQTVLGDSNGTPFQLVNLGNKQPVQLMELINAIENSTGKKAIIEFNEAQPGDMIRTSASTQKLEELIDFSPATSIADGTQKFVNWYRAYFEV